MSFNLSVQTESVNNKNFRDCMDYFTEQKLSARSAVFDREWEKAAAASLGKYTKSVNPAEGVSGESVLNLEQKQSIARSLVHGRLDQCGRVLLSTVNGEMRKASHGKLEVQIKKSETGKFFFSGLMHCGNVWSCPECASKITEARRNELSPAVASWIDQGHGVSLLTLTVPHLVKDSCKEITDGILKAYKTMLNRKAYKRVSKEIGERGRIRTLEVTYGSNGWHTHLHILLFTEKPIDEKILALKKELLSYWQSACVSSGLGLPNSHGLDLVNGSQAAAYISKWGLVEEMTKGHLKKGKKQGQVSPFGLLELYAQGDKKAGYRFKEFVEAFKGKRQLVYTKGLKELLGLNSDKTDQEIVDSEDLKAEVFVNIPFYYWEIITRHNLKTECLNQCEKGLESLRDWLASIGGLDEDVCSPHTWG